MKDFPIPVRAIGPGSQPDDADLDVMPMPHGMSTFRMPRVPEQVDPGALAASRDVLAGFLRALEAWDDRSSTAGPSVAMGDLDAATLAITNEVLGEGEVSIQLSGERRIRIQECAFTGLWRCLEADAQGRIVRDWLEAAAVPQAVLEAAHAASSPALRAVERPAGAMNSPALLAEIAAQLEARDAGAPVHSINLTLLPMTPDDHAVLERALPVGPVAIMSRGFGNCRVTSTLTHGVWRVQYFNNMNTLILNTIEVGDVPAVVVASDEDLADTRARLAELVAWMDEACADASSLRH